MAAVVVFVLAGSALADVRVWELPVGKPVEPVKRDGWKPGATDSKFSGGAAIENERLLLTAVPGSAGPVLWFKTPDMSSKTDLRIIGTGGGNIAGVKLLDADTTDVTLRLVTGAVEADFSLSAAKSHLEIKPGKSAQKLESAAVGRYALVPSFADEDKLYDSAQIKSAVVPVPGRLGLLQFMEGGNTILALLWKDASGGGVAGAKKADAEPETRKVDLAMADRGANRVFISAAVEFLGKPLYVGMLQGSNIWYSVDVRKLPGGKTMPVAWKRPFEAAWKVDMHVTDYDKQEIASFLKRAADLGLSKDRENDWRNSYLTMDEKRKDTDSLRIEASYFKPAGNDGKLPPFSSPAPEGDDRVWPFVFKGAETLVTVPAEWPCYLDPTKERLEAVQKKLAADGKESFWPIHVYGSFLIYPLDRTNKTPLDKFTVVDLMRQALGIGPCKLDWLEKCN